MKLRNFKPHALLALLPAVALAEIYTAGGKVDLNATLSETYDSNLSARSDAQGAYFTSLSPGASYVRDTSLLKTSAHIGMGIQRYFDHKEFNQETYQAGATLALEQGTLGNYSLSLGVNYSDGASANYDLGQRISSRSYGLTGSATVETSERTGLAFSSSLNRADTGLYGKQDTFSNSADFHFGPVMRDAQLFVTYSNSITKSSGKNELNVALDQSSNSLSVGIGKKLTEKLFGRVNAGYSWNSISNAEASYSGGNTSGAVVSASLTGPFLPEKLFPKTTSSFSISYSDSVSRGLYDSGGKQLSGSLSLGWQARENTHLSFNTSRSRRLALNDRTVDTSDIGVAVSERLMNGLMLNASAGYNWSTYVSKINANTEGFNYSASASYSFGAKQNWSALLSYRYTSNSSAIAFRNLSHYTAVASISYSY